MLFAHLKRILRLGRLRLRGPSGAKDEFLLAATAQNLRKLAKVIPFRRRPSPCEVKRRRFASLAAAARAHRARLKTGFFNEIDVKRTFGPRRRTSQSGSRPMLVTRALAVIGEDLDHAACGDTAKAASDYHRFQLAFESRKAANPPLNFGKSRPGDAVGRCAWLVRIVL